MNRVRLSTLFFTWIPLLIGLLLVGGLGGCNSADEEVAPDSFRVYVGTSAEDAEKGIHRFQFDQVSGTLTPTDKVTPVPSPTYLTLEANGEHLYSVSPAQEATIHAFDVDPATGNLTPMNMVPAKGGGPCYISVDETGQWVFTANFGGGNVAVFPVQADGSLGAASQVVQHSGSGPDPKRQTQARAHYIRVDPQNKYVLAADLGSDQVLIYPFDAESGHLDTSAVESVSTPAGTGPRHLTFGPNGEYVYVIGQLNGTINVYDYAADAGTITHVQTVSTLPEDFEGYPGSADIHVHPSGDVLYASNRGGVNDLVHYTIDEKTGALTFAGRQGDRIQWPRTFAIAPNGQYILVANQRGDSITVYDVDAEAGALTFTGQSIDVPSPTHIVFGARIKE